MPESLILKDFNAFFNTDTEVVVILSNFDVGQSLYDCPSQLSACATHRSPLADIEQLIPEAWIACPNKNEFQIIICSVQVSKE